jgi:hypothetical protein
MTRQEIIQLSEEGTNGILIETIIPFKKSLYTYFKRYYNCEPVLIVTDVYNAAQYDFIAPSNEMQDAIDTYLSVDTTLDEEEKENQVELISFQSILLKDL